MTEIRVGTEIHVRLVQPGLPVTLNSSAVARIRLLADLEGNPVDTWLSDEKAIATCGEPAKDYGYTVFVLPQGGFYALEVSLPRREQLLEQFRIASNEILAKSLTLTKSPQEELSWQQFAGIIRPQIVRQRSSELRDRSLDSRAGRLEAAAWERESEFSLRQLVSPKLHRVDLPDWPDWRYWPRWLSWSGWLDWIYDRLTSGYGSSSSLDELWNRTIDSNYASWSPELPSYDVMQRTIERLRRPVSLRPENDKFPRWVVVECGSSMHLASVPWEWWAESSQFEGIRLVYDRRSTKSPSRSDWGRLIVSVEDHRWFSILEFLTSGRLYQANPIADRLFKDIDSDSGPEMALYHKTKGPILAVLGAIVLLARTTSSKEAPWDQWLTNLAEWFPGIPDGPILLGYRQLQKAKDNSGLYEAFQNLKRGLQRGIPFASGTIHMLTTALAQLGSDIPEANFLSDVIARLAARVDADQPFTVIRLGAA